ncbi:MAG: Mur ligase family protein, partial [Syntrophothermus sp.]
MKYLRDILFNSGVGAIYGSADLVIKSLHQDSRSVRPGSLFFAVRGTASDGHVFIGKAIEAGAAAIVCEELPGNLEKEVTYCVVPDSTRAMGIVASNFYGNPSARMKLIGVTGTNGKTTTATLLEELFTSLGYKTGLVSTILYRINGKEIPSTHTTPDSITLNSMFARMVEEGCSHCFMEVSSHAVVQNRIAGLTFCGGIFTNLT